MAFHNRVRLPLNIDRAQFGSTREQYVKANGETKTLSVVLKKTYQGKTDWMPEKWHERLIVALSHDNVTIEGEKYFGGVALDGEYLIDWDDVFRTPIAGSKFQVLVTPFDNSNSNCMTCDEASQVVLNDDVFPSTLAENTSYTLDVIQNDEICCYPVVFSITSFNSTYLSSCTIDANGVVHIHTKTPLTDINGLKLLTYRATCANGGYDEADVYGDVNGSISACLAPTGLTITGVGNTGFHAAWTAPSPAPDHYYWKVLSKPGGAVLQSGDTTSLFVDITGLTANTDYTFEVRSQCAAGDADGTASNWIQLDLTTTPVAENTCGSYQCFPRVGGDPAPPHQGTITYLGCGGYYQTAHADLLGPINICALQSSPGVYIDIHSTFTGMTITYLGEC